MNKNSAVDFPTNSRIHIGLAVNDVQRSIRFYRTLFGKNPTKVRKGYAKFETVEPPVNLSLNEVSGRAESSNATSHFGI